MSDPDVKQLLAPLADYEPEGSARRFQVDRDKIIARMVEVSLAPEDRFSLRARWGVLALAAGFALAAWGGAHYLQGTQQASLPGVEVVVLRGQVTPLNSEGTLETSAGAEARIKAAGLELDLLENTKVSLKELGAAGRNSSAVRLDRGRVRCVIPHRPDRTFTVVTADARVVDLGTIFSVSVQPSVTGPKTFVEVEEGEVLVEYAGGQRRVTAAQSFSTRAAESPVPVAAPAEPAVVAEEAPRASGPGPRREPVKRPRETLGTETQLLRSGLASEQKGDLRAARAAFEQLVARYPESPLAPDARTALARVKGRLETSQ